MRLEGKVALVTGAARGQGRSHCEYLAREGANIVALDICEDIAGYYPMGTDTELKETVSRCEASGVQALGIKADVRREEQVKQAVEQGTAEFGRIDILCNNAGITTVGGGVDETNAETFDPMIDVMLKGPFYTMKYVVPGMRERRYGKIINTLSAGGCKPLAYVSHYGAIKGGLLMATISWAKELSEWGINVNGISPGSIRSGMLTGMAAQMGMDPDVAWEQWNGANLFRGERGEVTVDDISKAVAFLASDDARMITGQILSVDAGMMISG